MGKNDFIPEVLFLDGEALVVNKPAGLAVHPGPKTPESLEDRLDELRFGFARRPSIVHRLDRDTSGCLLLARNPKAHKRFAAAFEAGEVIKNYVAVLDGVPSMNVGMVHIALTKVSSPEGGWRMVPGERGQRAVTMWRTIAERDGRTLVIMYPQTGRTHQLRVHAATGIGVPIVGDPVYGNGGGPMLLHAAYLGLERSAKPPIEAQAPLPQSFIDAGFGDAL